MTTLLIAGLIALLAAALCGWTLSAHHGRQHRRWAESAEADAEELRRAVREVRAELAWSRRTLAAVVLHIEKREAAALTALAERLDATEDELAAARKRKAARPKAVASK